MLYTIIPESVIYQQEIAPPSYERRNGITVEMRAGAYGMPVCARIHTTDLRHYLAKEHTL